MIDLTAILYRQRSVPRGDEILSHVSDLTGSPARDVLPSPWVHPGSAHAPGPNEVRPPDLAMRWRSPAPCAPPGTKSRRASKSGASDWTSGTPTSSSTANCSSKRRQRHGRSGLPQERQAAQGRRTARSLRAPWRDPGPQHLRACARTAPRDGLRRALQLASK